MYDAVIVGAGLAGLTAAARLGARKLLVIERDTRCGGRILTRQHGDLTCELGAIFASGELPAGEHPLAPVASAGGGIVLHAGGRWIRGYTPLECMHAGLASDTDARDALSDFAAGTRDASQVGDPARQMLDAFFHVLHPGGIDASLRVRQRDALAVHAQGFPPAGNGSHVAWLMASLAGSLVTQAEGLCVTDEGDWVRVEFLQEGRLRVVRGRAVIVATPPDKALSLIRCSDASVVSFLEAVRFLPGLVFAVGMKQCDVQEFNYLVSMDSPFNSVIQRRPGSGDMTVLHVYYLGEKRLAMTTRCAGQDSMSAVVEDLRQAGVVIPAATASFIEMQDWAGVGPEISDTAYGRAIIPFVVSPRIFLAGDYTWFDRADRFPFGMHAAVASGRRAADAVDKLLQGADVPYAPPARRRKKINGLPPLLHGTVYELSQHAPRFLRHVSEGNIAYYGLLLQASGDRRLASYLAEVAVDDLWEFHAGFGVTAADSALVLEGLMSINGYDAAALSRSAARLVDKFFVEEKGAFATVVGGRATYWEGVSTETTAHVAWLLRRIDGLRWRDQVERGARYIRREQFPDGHWEGRWYPSHVIPTYYALRLLVAVDDGISAERIERARAYLLRTQLDNGSWSHLVIDTAASMLALALAGGAEAGIARARAWLEAKIAAGDLSGEPVLYYWYDDAGDSRKFFCARDAGKIARSWAALALGRAIPQ